MSEITGFIEATKIQPVLEDLVITPSKEEQNFKSKVDGYDNIRVNSVPFDTLKVTPTKEEQNFNGVYDKVIVDAIEGDTLNITPSEESQTFNGVYENVNVEPIKGKILNVTPSEELQNNTGIYTEIYVQGIQTEEVVPDIDFSNADQIEIVPTEGKYVKKVTLNKPVDLEPQNISVGKNIYGVEGINEYNASMSTDYQLKAGNTSNNYSYLYQMIRKIPDDAYIPSTLKTTQCMFFGCARLEELHTLDMQNITNARYMIHSCGKLKNISLKNTNKVTDFYYFAYNDSSLEEVEIDSLAGVTSSANLKNMFYNCTALSDTGLNNILQLCTTASCTASLSWLGLTSEQATRCQSLSNYQAFLDAGWQTGF